MAAYGQTEADHSSEVSAFREAEKKFKNTVYVEDALELGAVDLHFNSGGSGVVQSSRCTLFGKECNKHVLEGYEGLTIITDCLTEKQQVELSHHSLSESLAPPNRTNLHCHEITDEMKSVLQSSIWRCDGPKLDLDDARAYERSAGPDTTRRSGVKKSTNKKQKREIVSNGALFRMPSGTTLSKVRWATLGYQYNWTERSYSADQHVSFPSQLGELAVKIAEKCGESILPQAGIVNFYPEGQVMGGHVDDGEEARENPVVSVSIGSPCVFILGGHTKKEVPVALLLRSGDCVVLGGKARLRYHGVSKVFVASHGPPPSLLPSQASTYTLKEGEDEAGGIHCAGCPHFLSLNPSSDHENDSRACACTCGRVDSREVSRVLKVLACVRINLNLRQVYSSHAKSA
jgi:alkylated DNA repair protein alkB family protein 1